MEPYTYRILARAAGLPKVEAGEEHLFPVERRLLYPWPALSDWFAQVLEQELGGRLPRPQEVYMTFDHMVPVKNAAQEKFIRESRAWASSKGIHVVEGEGIGHLLAIQEGWVKPGMVVPHFDTHVSSVGAIGALGVGLLKEMIYPLATGRLWLKIPPLLRIRLTGRLPQGVMGRDLLHTLIGKLGLERCGGKIVEFGGEGAAAMALDDRITVCNLANCLGAVSALFDPEGASWEEDGKSLSFSLEELEPSKEAGWTNYPKGVMWAFGEKGMQIPFGMDLMLYGNIPNGSGLSSSASVEVLTGYILRDFFGFQVSNQDLALIGQYAENNFNKVNCGIMDQFAIAMGKKEHAIFLDTADLSFEYAPIVLEGAKIVIASSNKKRGLGDSKYNERRSECETALAELQQEVQIGALGDLNEETFERYQSAIKDDVRRKRAKHAVYENQRTIRAVEALKANNVALFGQLMNDSHVSLRDDYEVTGIELDTLVEGAWKVDGVIGSRMTGAGFGGCTVSIVKDEAIDTFIEKVGSAYKEKIGYAADFYVVEVGDGPVTL